jgi:rod shape-determining protein MreD
MDMILLTFVLLFLKFAFTNFFSLPFSFFDPLLCIVIIYTFFHSLDFFAFAALAIFCGILRDVFSLDVFGVYFFSFMLCTLAVVFVARLVNRDNWLIVLPIVFLCVLFNNFLAMFLKPLLGSFSSEGISGWFLIRNFIEALGTTALAYCLIIFSKKCDLKLIR